MVGFNDICQDLVDSCVFANSLVKALVSMLDGKVLNIDVVVVEVALLVVKAVTDSVLIVEVVVFLVVAVVVGNKLIIMIGSGF